MMLSLQVKNGHVLAFLLLLSLVVYAPVINAPFFSDDFTILYRLTTKGFDAGSFFRPLSEISIYVDYLLYGTRAAGYHLSNILIHGATAFLCYVAGMELFKISAKGSGTYKYHGLVIAILFLVYPFHSEAVVWVVGRGVLLATFFGVLSLVFYLKANGRVLYFVLAALCYFMSLFGYESTVILPLIILVIEACFKKSSRLTVTILLFFAFAAMMYGIIRFSWIGDLVGEYKYFSLSSTFGEVTLNALRLVERSILPPLRSSLLAGALFIVLMSAGLIVFLYRTSSRHRKHWALYIVLFFISLLPVVTVGIDTHDTEGERFLYFPSFFLILLIVYLVHLLFNSAAKRTIAAAVLFLYFTFFLFISLRNWTRAGDIITNIHAQRERYQTTGNLYIVNMPDNYRGAYIFRNGFESSFKLLKKPLGAEKIVVLSFLHINNNTGNAGSSAGKEDSVKGFSFTRKERGQGVHIRDSATGKGYLTKPGDKIFFFKHENLHELR